MTMGSLDLLFAAARASSGGPTIDTKDLDPDWEVVLAAAEFHGLAPLLHLLVASNPSLTPGRDVAASLHDGYIESSKRALFLTARLCTLLDAFDHAGIQVIPLKGPPLAELLYGDSALRPSFDLDLLVHRADVPKGLQVLEEQGYALPARLAHLPHPRLLRLESEALLRQDRGAAVELHWAVAPPDFPFAFDAEVLWRGRRPLEFAGRTIAGLSPECLLLYLCVHGTKHRWSRLRWLADLSRLAARGPDWNASLPLADAARCRRPLLLGLLVAADVLGTRVPSDLLVLARSDPAVTSAAGDVRARLRRLPPSEPTSVELTAFNARLAERLRDKVRHWAAMVLTPKDEDLDRGSLPDALFWIHRASRVQRLVAKYGSRLIGRPGR